MPPGYANEPGRADSTLSSEGLPVDPTMPGYRAIFLFGKPHGPHDDHRLSEKCYILARVLVDLLTRHLKNPKDGQDMPAFITIALRRLSHNIPSTGGRTSAEWRRVTANGQRGICHH
ncbi:hypothetical protein Bbelb_075940 [Branchiostoma belcheri]|nr:hypothetical protein Bbelb_075940 [Branchiostoma belcheri]